MCTIAWLYKQLLINFSYSCIADLEFTVLSGNFFLEMFNCRYCATYTKTFWYPFWGFDFRRIYIYYFKFFIQSRVEKLSRKIQNLDFVCQPSDYIIFTLIWFVLQIHCTRHMQGSKNGQSSFLDCLMIIGDKIQYQIKTNFFFLSWDEKLKSHKY